jgi:signal transduction histidine kinase
LKKVIRNLILGEDHYVESYPQFKQVMLSGQLAMISIAVCLACGSIDLLAGKLVAIVVFVPVIIMLILSIVWHRKGRHQLAHASLLVPIGVACYLLASSEDPGTGAFVHFISISLAGFIVFGYKQRHMALIFAGITLLLFFLSYFGNYTVLPMRQYSPDTMLALRLINFSTALLACMMGVYLLIHLNHKNYVQLMESYHMLTKTNTELDRFVYSTSHDLRAPLTSMMGLIHIAERSNEPAESVQYLEMMKDRVTALDKFITDITDYSRNNRVAVKVQRIRLAQLACEIWEMLKYTPEAKDIIFQLDIPEEIEIESDVSRLRTILLNVISNAMRYHDPSKPNRFVRLNYSANGKGFYLRIEDNGQGIDPAFHSRIFDMFYRANDGSKGSGLGLYIVKETLAKLSGSVHLESKLGIGSTFTINLPR